MEAWERAYLRDQVHTLRILAGLVWSFFVCFEFCFFKVGQSLTEVKVECVWGGAQQ